MPTADIVWNDLVTSAKSNLAKGQFDAACESLESAVNLVDEEFGDDDERSLHTWIMLGMAQQGASRHIDAAMTYERGLQLAEQHWGRHDQRLVPILKGLADSRLATLEWEYAEIHLSRCLTIAADSDNADKHVPKILDSLANVYVKLRNLDRAVWAYNKLINFHENSTGNNKEIAALVEKRDGLLKLQQSSAHIPRSTVGTSSIASAPLASKKTTTSQTKPTGNVNVPKKTTTGGAPKPGTTSTNLQKPAASVPPKEDKQSPLAKMFGGLFGGGKKKEEKYDSHVDGVDVRALLDDEKLEKYREGKRTDGEQPALFDIGASILTEKYDDIMDKIDGKATGGGQKPGFDGKSTGGGAKPDPSVRRPEGEITHQMQKPTSQELQRPSTGMPAPNVRIPPDLEVTQQNIKKNSIPSKDQYVSNAAKLADKYVSQPNQGDQTPPAQPNQPTPQPSVSVSQPGAGKKDDVRDTGTHSALSRRAGEGFERFEMGELLGTGGMGSVYKAFDKVTQKTVAVKVLNANLTGDPNFVKRVTKEALAASRMLHQNIVRVLDHGPAPDGFYIAMDYVAGTSWDDEIEKAECPAEPKETIDILKQVSQALAYAHGLGVIHRDIKPENIMISRADKGGPKVKVLDFGLAKFIAGAELGSSTLSCTLTQEGSFLGSPLFVSPEQIRAQEVDVRSDIYSLGAVAYFALTKKHPIDAPSIAEILIAQLRQAPKPFSASRPDMKYPPGLEELVMKMLAKEPEGRPQTMVEVQLGLEAIKG